MYSEQNIDEHETKQGTISSINFLSVSFFFLLSSSLSPNPFSPPVPLLFHLALPKKSIECRVRFPLWSFRSNNKKYIRFSRWPIEYFIIEFFTAMACSGRARTPTNDTESGRVIFSSNDSVFFGFFLGFCFYENIRYDGKEHRLDYGIFEWCWKFYEIFFFIGCLHFC